jgi:predicted Zn-dependent protease
MTRFEYVTLAEQQADDAREYLARADNYRTEGNEQNALGCERKALKKLENGFLYASVSRKYGI